MNMIDELINRLQKALAVQKDKETSAYDTTAKVLRIVGKTAIVHIDGGVPETPVNMTIKCTKGDTVRVRLTGGTAFLVGNDTAPPSDDTEALVAKAVAKLADSKAENAESAATDAQETAEQALATAQNVEQHFWNETSGTEAGAHITEVSQGEWSDSTSANYHTGANLLLRSNTIKLRNALVTLAELVATGLKIYEPNDSTNPVAQFLNSGIMLGKGTGQHFILTPNGMSLYDGSTNIGSFTFSYASNTYRRIYLRAERTNNKYALVETESSSSSNSDTSHSALRAYNGERYAFVYAKAGTEYNGEGTEAFLGAYNGTNTGQIKFDFDANGNAIAGISTDKFNVDGVTTLGALNNGIFAIESYSKSSVSVSASSYATGTISATKSGYYPLGIVGVHSSSSYTASAAFYLTNISDGSCTINYQLANTSASSRTTNLTYYVLWLKTSA